MKQRKIGQFKVSAIGLGCMNLSHAYGTPPSYEHAESLLLKALDMGVTFFDTAALYGFGANEEIIGRLLSPYRHNFTLASKCGMFHENGKRSIDGRPQTLKRTCEDSLKRLRTDVIDLYYLHRWDKKVPIEDSIGALAELVKEGKIRSIGLSEVSAITLLKAHAIHPITAVQTEYSLWTRNPEIAVLKTCEQLGTAFVAFSPLARGFLTGKLRDVSIFDERDIRRAMPRFAPDNYVKNMILLDRYIQIAEDVGCTAAQLSLAWLLARSDHIVPIPGTTNLLHLQENISAVDVSLSSHVIESLNAIINNQTVTGSRYNAATQSEIDTEEF